MSSLFASQPPVASFHINDFPTEILACIFSAVHRAAHDVDISHPEDASAHFDPKQSKSKLGRLPPQFALSGVCQRWRALAGAMPNLWVSIDLCIPPDLIRTSLSRSRLYPLHITWTQRTPPPLTSSTRCSSSPPLAGFRLVLPHASRWESLSFRATDQSHLSPMLDCLQNVFAQSLLSLTIAFPQHKDYRQFGHHIPRVFAGGAPCLRTVDITGLNPACLQIPCAEVSTMIWRAHVPPSSSSGAGAGNSGGGGKGEMKDASRFIGLLKTMTKLETLILELPDGCTLMPMQVQASSQATGTSTTMVMMKEMVPTLQTLVVNVVQ